MIPPNKRAKLSPPLEEWKKTAAGRVDQAIQKIMNCDNELKLQKCALNSLPPEIGWLTQLAHLFLSENSLASLPAEIGLLTRLTYLGLNKNKLLSLPTEIGQLTTLYKLDLDNNQLSSLPTQIGRLTNLKKFSICNNQLSSLPAEIWKLTQLTHFRLAQNKFKALPPEIGALTNLRWLCLMHNELTALPAEIGRLRTLSDLDINNNQFTSLPAEFGQLTNMERLSLFGNPHLRTLPMTLGEIPGLTRLDIDWTGISEDLRDSLLRQCTMQRNKGDIDALLQTRFSKWKVYGNSDAALPDCTVNEKLILNEWLLRLEKTKDFAKAQGLLAKTVCSLLSDLAHPEFKALFFSQAEANNGCCEDRAAMALNEIYTAWLVLCKSSSPSLLKGVAKTLHLRKCLQKLIQKHAPNEKESVEIFLYYETALREALQLETAIRHMSYSTIGCRAWIDPDALIKEVNENFYEELIDLPLFANWDAINAEFHAQLESLGECPQGPEFDPQVLAYKARQGEIMAAWRERKIAQAKKVCNE